MIPDTISKGAGCAEALPEFSGGGGHMDMLRLLVVALLLTTVQIILGR